MTVISCLCGRRIRLIAKRTIPIDDLVPIGLDSAEVEKEEPAPEVDYSRPQSEMEVPISISAEVSHTYTPFTRSG